MANEARSSNGLALMKAALTRRQLLRILGVSTVTIGTTTLLVACAEDDDDPDVAADPDDDPEDEAPDIDDDVDDGAEADDDEVPEDAERSELVIGVHGLPDTFDPHENISQVAFMSMYSIFETLIRRDWLDSDPAGYGNTLVPMLAEDWEFLEDTTLEVSLREDVVWHNGDPFSADDVLFTFERMEVEEAVSRAPAYFETVTDIERVDDYTVRFHTDDPDPLLAMRFAIRPAWIIPKDHYEEVGLDGFRFDPVGTGPYKVTSFEPDVELITEANDEYYMERPVASGVRMRMIPEVSARVAALVSGEIDIATALPPDQRETIEAADGVHAKSVESLNFQMIRFNCHHPHLSDARIRRALCHAIDRQLLVDTLWFGEARVPAGHQFIDFSDDMTFDEFQLPYDPDRARELMEEAGYDGEQLVLRVFPGYYTLYEDAAQAIIEMWSEVGFNAEIELTQDPWEEEEDNMMHNWSNSSHMGDPAGSQWSNWGEGQSGQNWWDAPEEYNELGRQQAGTLDEDERVEIWRRMNEIWMDERPGTPLYNQLETYGISDRVNYQPFGSIYMDLRNYNLSFND